MGCATAPIVTPTAPPGLPGIYHRVEKGQTLYRISKTYNIDLPELVRVNRISDATSIEIGQLIFIPYGRKPDSLPTSYVAEDFIWPIRGKIITTFGQTFNNLLNKGINIQPYRSQEVLAARSGKVVFLSPNFKGFGKTIIIDHGDGFLTVYARMLEILIKAGVNVQRGTSIARVGSVGQSKDNYLHFEIRKGYIPQNPIFYLSR